VNPCYWTIYGLVASQVGDFTNELTLGSGLPSTPKAFIASQYGYHHNYLGKIVAILFSWLIFLFAISYICFRYLLPPPPPHVTPVDHQLVHVQFTTKAEVKTLSNLTAAKVFVACLVQIAKDCRPLPSCSTLSPLVTCASVILGL